MIKNQDMSVCAIAKILGKHRSTVQRWLADYRETGIERMLEFGVSPGRTRVIDISENNQSFTITNFQTANAEPQR